MGYWETNSGDTYVFTSSVSVGDPTRASWANSMIEKCDFLRYTRAPFVKAKSSTNQGNGGVTEYEIGNNTGILLNSVGYLAPDSYVRLTKDTDDMTGMPSGGDGFKYRMVYIAGKHDLVANVGAAQSYMPQGTGDSWLNINAASNLAFRAFWSGNGNQSGGGNNTSLWIGGADSTGVLVSDTPWTGAGGGTSGISDGELLLFNDNGANYLTFNLLIFAGPKWSEVA